MVERRLLDPATGVRFPVLPSAPVAQRSEQGALTTCVAGLNPAGGAHRGG
jgi:hypothetical protein